MKLVLGAGLAGLSAAYHHRGDDVLILERSAHPGGHIHVQERDGFTWDEGPHVSFTPHEYVRSLFTEGAGQVEEYPVLAGNYFQGNWIDHPAQTNLFQVPEPLRSKCVESFLETRKRYEASEFQPQNYGQWLEYAFGPVFANTFPAAYTRKYWTVEPEEMTTDWVGKRVFFPKVEDVLEGSKAPLPQSAHYIKTVRYPSRGGYLSFAGKLIGNAKIRYGSEVERIHLGEKRVQLRDRNRFSYDQLVSTMPLPDFIRRCEGVPDPVREAAHALDCTGVLLVNVIAPHPTQRRENWIYVYDEDKLSSRVYCTEKMAPSNAPEGWTGIQVEVYYGPTRRPEGSPEEIAKRVTEELVEMGMIDPNLCGGLERVQAHTHWVPWANVLFHHQTAPALETIWTWLEAYGLRRESDDLHPLTDWSGKDAGKERAGDLIMAGRFGQWKYFWTDDCVLRGKWLNG